jgi:hypothetical protein
MSLMDEIYKRIKEEIANDPEGIGYAGKSDDEIMDLLNKRPEKERIVIDYGTVPINRILAGIESAPNMVDAKDVTEASKAIITKG